MLKKTGFTHKILNARTIQDIGELPKTETPNSVPTATDSQVITNEEIEASFREISLNTSETKISDKKGNKKLTKDEIVEAAEKAAFEA